MAINVNKVVPEGAFWKILNEIEDGLAAETMTPAQATARTGLATPWLAAGAAATPESGAPGWNSFVYFVRYVFDGATAVTQTTFARNAGADALLVPGSVKDLPR